MEWLDGEALAARLARQRLSVSESLRLDAPRRRPCSHGRPRARRRPPRHQAQQHLRRLKRRQADQAPRLRHRPHLARSAPAPAGTGMVLGTLGYIAPEQLREPRGQRPALGRLALGCVIFECLTGRAPAFEGAHAMAVLAEIVLQQTPRTRDVRPEIPEALDGLVARMMAKTPGRSAPGRGRRGAGARRDRRDRPRPAAPRTSAPRGHRSPPPRDRAPSSITRLEQRLVDSGVRRRGRADAGAARGPPSSVGQMTHRGRGARRAFEAALEAFGGHLTELPGRSLVVTQWGSGSVVGQRPRAALVRIILRAHITQRLRVRRHRPQGWSSAPIDRGTRSSTASALCSSGRKPGAIKLDDVSANADRIARPGAPVRRQLRPRGRSDRTGRPSAAAQQADRVPRTDAASCRQRGRARRVHHEPVA